MYLRRGHLCPQNGHLCPWVGHACPKNLILAAVWPALALTPLPQRSGLVHGRIVKLDAAREGLKNAC